MFQGIVDSSLHPVPPVNIIDSVCMCLDLIENMIWWRVLASNLYFQLVIIINLSAANRFTVCDI